MEKIKMKVDVGNLVATQIHDNRPLCIKTVRQLVYIIQQAKHNPDIIEEALAVIGDAPYSIEDIEGGILGISVRQKAGE